MKKENYYCMRYYVTYRCSSRCQYCNVWQDNRFQNVQELGLAEAKELISQCYRVGVRYIDFTGGEPTLNPNLVQLLQYAKSLGIKTEVTTNGIPHAQGHLEEIAVCADKFNLSLDTLQRDTYHKVRGIDGLDKVLETMEKLQHIRPPKIMTVISQDNLAELDCMIRYAQQHHSEIYLNPVFPYFTLPDTHETATIIRQIIARIFEPYTVVMLHFMEFLGNPDAAQRPPCSANHRTLTFAPDGSLMLPCYHNLKETIPWNVNLTEMLASKSFTQYSCPDAQKLCGNHCSVIPYFGISFNYRLDAYFLLQSYSEKLNHLKRDYLNRIPELNVDAKKLQIHLTELVDIIRSLHTDPDHTFNGLYWTMETSQGFYTDVYRTPLTREEYLQEAEAEDCWGLRRTPHYGFDQITDQFYRKAFAAYQTGTCKEEALEIFQDAMEFQLRLWKFYISKYFNVAIVCDYKAEQDWLERYMERLQKLA